MATVAKNAPAWTVLHGVSYDAYVAMRDEPRNGSLRMTYYDGTLEVTSPEYCYEKWTERLSLIVRAYAAAFRVPCQGVRCTTFRRGVLGRKRGQGKEPDAGYYVGPVVSGLLDKDKLDLEVDPPPTLWIETDNRSGSQGRLPLYARLGVPEVWRYEVRRRRLWFGLLDAGNGTYDATDRSCCLPGLTVATALDLVREGEGLSETEWVIWLRAWIPANLRHAAD